MKPCKLVPQLPILVSLVFVLVPIAAGVLVVWDNAYSREHAKHLFE